MTKQKEPMKLDLKAPHQEYFHKDGKQVVGVTTLLGVLGKDALMPWAAKMEREGVREFVLRAVEQVNDRVSDGVARVVSLRKIDVQGPRFRQYRRGQFVDGAEDEGGAFGVVGLAEEECGEKNQGEKSGKFHCASVVFKLVIHSQRKVF